MARRWSDLSDGSRKLIIAVAVVEAGLKAAVLVDLKRRPASQVRGSRRIWAVAMLVNSAGLIPLSYFLFGRRRPEAKDLSGGVTVWRRLGRDVRCLRLGVHGGGGSERGRRPRLVPVS